MVSADPGVDGDPPLAWACNFEVPVFSVCTNISLDSALGSVRIRGGMDSSDQTLDLPLRATCVNTRS